MKIPPAMANWCLNATSSVKFVVNAGCGVNALSGLQKHADSIYCRINVDTVMACKFFPGPVSLIAGMPDTAPSGAVFFIPSAIFTPLPDYAVTHRTARLTSALHTPPV
ncbi:hypothetical protein, partial [Escherichia coli]|uniref:hypothetical protein n=1 Tax=Escherichia coli TaxID=562 RepID=UPI00234C7306